MNSWEVELQAAVAFLTDQIEDLRLLMGSTPDEVLSGETGQSLMQQALDAMSKGLGFVLARKVWTMPRGTV